MGAIYKLGEDAPADIFSNARCAFGVFDGVHKGHLYVLGCAKDDAAAHNAPFVVITFDKDPDELFRPHQLKKLMTNDARLNLLSSIADAVAVLPFSKEFSQLAPYDFLNSVFGDSVPASLHVGVDFKFGSKASGNVDDLTAWGIPQHMQVYAHELLSIDGRPVTATRIRGLLSQGDIAQANELLGRYYSIEGVVLEGRGEGANMGFRTANLQMPEQLRTLSDGVYAAYANVSGARYKAAVNVGIAATFADRSTATCEAHLLHFEGDLYGKAVEIEFVSWLRPMKKFDDVNELISVVKSNIAWVDENL